MFKNGNIWKRSNIVQILIILLLSITTLAKADWPQFQGNPAHTGSDGSLISFTFTLNPGWNLVSFPFVPSNASFASIFSGVSYWQVQLWDGSKYITPTFAEVGKYYQVLVLSTTNVTITGTGQPITSPEEIWNYTTYGTNVISVSNGVIYADGFNDATQVQYLLYAINASTGNQIWNKTDFMGQNSVLLEHNGLLYYCPGATVISAINATTGGNLWDTQSQPYGVLQTPTIDSEMIITTSRAGQIEEFNASNGSIINSKTATNGSISAPTVSNGIIYAIVSPNTDIKMSYITAYNETDLQSLWNSTAILQQPTGMVLNSTSPPVAVSDSIVVSYLLDGNLYAWNATTGLKLWNYINVNEYPQIDSSLSIDNGAVYFVDPDPSGVYLGGQGVAALNLTTGALMWQDDGISYAQNIAVTPTASNGLVYIGGTLPYSPDPPGNYSVLYALNETTGSVVLAYTSVQRTASDAPIQGILGNSDNISTSIIISGDQLYFGTHNGFVYALNQTNSDVTPPYLIALGYTSSMAGNYSVFYLHVNDNVQLQNATLVTNATGTVTNYTIDLTDTDSWANVTINLTSAIGATVTGYWTVYDASGNIEVTPTITLLTYNGFAPSFAYSGETTTIAGTMTSFTTYVKAILDLKNWTFYTNSSGSWKSISGAFSPSLTASWINATVELPSSAGVKIQYNWTVSDIDGNSNTTTGYMVTKNSASISSTVNDIFNNYYAYLDGWNMFSDNQTGPGSFYQEMINLKAVLVSRGWNGSHIEVDDTGDFGDLASFISTQPLDNQSALLFGELSHGSTNIFLNWHSYDELQNVIGNGPEKQNILMLCSCYSGSALQTSLASSKNNIITSSDAAHASIDSFVFWNRELLNNNTDFYRTDQNNDGIITDTELYNMYNSSWSSEYWKGTGTSIPLDVDAPLMATIFASSLTAGKDVRFTASPAGNIPVSYFRWGSNSTGSWTYGEWQAWTSNPVTFDYVLNDTVGVSNGVSIDLNDNLGNSNTIIQYFTGIPECVESWSCTDWTACSGGLQTRTCTDANSCCTTTLKPAESQSCSAGGGGGGGGASTGIIVSLARGNANVTVSSIAAGKMSNISIAKYQDVDFRQINISVTNAVNNIKLVILKIVGLPASVSHDISGKVYHYVQIGKTNFTDTDVNKVYIKFAVNKTWFTNNGVDKTNISLYRWSNDKWNELTTTFIGNDSYEMFYRAESPGFSYFLIGTMGGEITVAPSPTGAAITCTESWSCTEWSTCTNNQQTRTCTDANTCGTTVNKPVELQSCISKAEITGIAPWVYPSIAVVIIVVIAIVLLVFRKKITTTSSKNKKEI